MAILILYVFALLIAFPLGEIARIDLGKGIAFSLLDLSIGILFFITVFHSVKNKTLNKSFVYSRLLPFLLFCLLSLVANALSVTRNQLVTSSLYLVRFVFYAGIVETVSILMPKNRKLVSMGMLGSGLLLLIAGFIQFIFYPSLRNLYYAGWDVHFYRVFSTFLDPNFVGAFFVLFLLYQLYLVSTNKQRYKKTLLSIGVAATVLGIILTFSRSSYVMLLVGVLLFFFLSGKKKMVILAGSILILLFGLVAFYPGRHREATNLFRQVSTSARIHNMQNALMIAKDNIVFGVGFNTYRYVQHRYGIFTGSSWEEGHGNAGADNSFLFVLATTGLLGLAAYLYFFTSLLKKLWKKVIKKDALSIWIFTTIITLMAGSLFTNLLFYPSLLFWLWSVVGFID